MKDKIRQNHPILPGKAKKKEEVLFVEGHPSKGHKKPEKTMTLKLHIKSRPVSNFEQIFET